MPFLDLPAVPDPAEPRLATPLPAEPCLPCLPFRATARSDVVSQLIEDALRFRGCVLADKLVLAQGSHVVLNK